MTNAKHTPGPWRVCGGYTPCYIGIYSTDGYVVFGLADKTTHTEGHDGGRIKAPSMEAQRANARLIAAAPELLEALRIIVANAEVVSDPRMNGTTDAYIVSVGDIETAMDAIAKAEG